jgi:2-desacetyl-2-hydroxyethyl bacteriochlorophyllide A dehydrogenase
MRQAVMIAPGKIEIREVPEPKWGAGEVLMRIKRIGVCGSDVHVNHGTHPYTGYPVVQGHEFSAIIEQAGEEVRNLKPGMKVTAMPQLVCGKCRPCLRGDYHICEELKVEGFQAPGCAQELFATSAEKVVPLPDDFTFEQGALVEPASVAVHTVCRAPDLKGKNVAVFGAGPIGNLVAQVAQAAGARVLITDLSSYRLAVARDCGLNSASNATEETLDEAVRRVFGSDGFDVAFECAGVEETIESAIGSIGKGGIIVVVGVFDDRPCIDIGLLQDRELSLIGTLMYKRADYEEAIKLIAQGKIVTAPLESEHFPLERYSEAYSFIDKQGERCMKVFIDL